MSLEHLNQVVQHAQIDGYLRGDLFDEISLLGCGDVKVRRICICETTADSKARIRS